MHPALRQIITSAPAPIIPASVKPSCLAWWDGQKRGSVWAGLTQLVANGNFANALTGWSLSTGMSVVDGVCIIDTATSVAGRYTINTTNGHKYYVVLTHQTTSSGVDLSLMLRLTSTVTSNSLTLPNTHTTSGKISAVLTATADGNNISIARVSVVETGQHTIDNMMLFDLTAHFGASNEPTAAEMDAILASEPAYWDGTRTVLANPASKYYWQDYSGNGRHMKLNNMAYTAGSGWTGDTLVTDGVDDFGIRQDTWSAENQSFTTMCVFNVATTESKQLIYATQKAGAGSLLLLVNGSSGFLELQALDSGTIYKVTFENFGVGKWHVANAVYDQSIKKAGLYLDGKFIAETGELPTGIRQINKITCGINTNETAYSAQSIRALAAFNRALSAGEVAKIYQNNRRRWGL